MLKLNKLFYYTEEPDAFCAQIEPTQTKRDFLARCKNEIRDHLRPRIQKATIEILGMEKAVDPRFRTQGSWAYKTCVQPVFMPPQEMDWDYGVYLPVSVWEDNGPHRAMAKLYFDLVEGLPKDLCIQKNGLCWKANPKRRHAFASKWLRGHILIFLSMPRQSTNLSKSEKVWLTQL